MLAEIGVRFTESPAFGSPAYLFVTRPTLSRSVLKFPSLETQPLTLTISASSTPSSASPGSLPGFSPGLENLHPSHPLQLVLGAEIFARGGQDRPLVSGATPTARPARANQENCWRAGARQGCPLAVVGSPAALGLAQAPSPPWETADLLVPLCHPPRGRTALAHSCFLGFRAPLFLPTDWVGGLNPRAHIT